MDVSAVALLLYASNTLGILARARRMKNLSNSATMLSVGVRVSPV